MPARPAAALLAAALVPALLAAPLASTFTGAAYAQELPTGTTSAQTSALQISSPASGSTVSGTSVRIVVSGSSPYDAPELYLNGVRLALYADSTDAGHVFTWDSTTVSNGSHEFRAGERYYGPSSAPVTVQVSNVAPTVAVTSPAEGAQVSGSVPLTAEAAADSSRAATLARVDFSVNGAVVGTDYSAPYALVWNTFQTSMGADGPAAITAVAYDTQGLKTVSATRNVAVKNTEDLQVVTPGTNEQVSGTAVVIRTRGGSNTYDAPRLFLDGVLMDLYGEYDGATQTFAYTWDSTDAVDGEHELRAGDRYSGAPSSTPVRFTVRNSAPVVTVTSPAVGAVLSGTVPLAADIAAGAGSTATIEAVSFRLDDTLVGVDYSAPFALNVDSRQYRDGAYTLTVAARDSSGLTGTATQQVSVKNGKDTAIVAPVSGARIAGSEVMIRLTRSEEDYYEPVLFVDGVQTKDEPARNASTGEYVFAWDSRTVANGSHELRVAEGTSEAVPTSPAVRIDVQNTPLRLSLGASTITSGQSVVVTGRANPGERVELYGYARPSTAYRLLRTGRTDSSGLVRWTLMPTTNTRVVLSGARTSVTYSSSYAVSVRPKMTVYAYSEEGTTIFYGDIKPCRNGKPVSIHRLTSTGRVLLVSGRSDCLYGGYSLYRTMLPRGSYTLVATTAADANNAAGTSAPWRYTQG